MRDCGLPTGCDPTWISGRRRTPLGISPSEAPSIRAGRGDAPRPHFDADDRRYGEPETGPDYGTDQVPTQLGDLPHDALDVRLECGEVDALGVGTRKHRGAIVWHLGGMPEDGCSTVSDSRGPTRVRNGWKADLDCAEIGVRLVRLNLPLCLDLVVVWVFFR